MAITERDRIRQSSRHKAAPDWQLFFALATVSVVA